MERLDIVFKLIATVFGAITGYMFGEWNTLLQVLLVFVVIDYLSGLIAGGVEGGLSSKVGFKGIAKKVMIFLLVAVAHMIDTALGESHVFRDAVTCFYIANEALSIIENSGRVGLPIPDVLKNAVNVLKQKGDKR